MDLFGNSLLVLTYRNAYLFNFRDLGKEPIEIKLPYVGQREAVTFSHLTPKRAFVSRERRHGTEVADIFQISNLPDIFSTP